MREYLESLEVQRAAARMFEGEKPVGAICHGVIVLARTRGDDGRSVCGAATGHDVATLVADRSRDDGRGLWGAWAGGGGLEGVRGVLLDNVDSDAGRRAGIFWNGGAIGEHVRYRAVLSRPA